IGEWQHWRADAEVAATAAVRRGFVTSVRVALLKASSSTFAVALPGATEASEAPSIYSRTSGYVAKRYVDIGDRAESGDLLAEITAPELDHQVAQARATLTQTQAGRGQAA